jgi:glycosyltransferase involved in cell wall biosynthesis
MICQTQGRRPRALLLAYCCSPYHGSEPGMGWSFAQHAARYCDTWVLCEGRKFGPHIRRYLAEHGAVPGLNFVFVDEKPWAKPMWSLPGLGYLSYRWWHQRAFDVARRLHEKFGFDLAHQVNIIGYREPGLLWQLGIPFVWGPVGGAENYPWRFLGESTWRGALLESGRSLANTLQLRCNARLRQVARKASALIAANTTNQRRLYQASGIQPVVVPEVNAPYVAPAPNTRLSSSEPLRILWSGGCSSRKALSLLIKALGRLPRDVPYELCVLGDGPMRATWQQLACRLGVDRHTRWLGEIPHHQALEQFRSAHLFAFTSLRDTTGTVVMEALGAGLPVVCLHHNGAGDAVNELCGVRIPVTRPDDVILRLAGAIASLARDETYRHRLAWGALRRARDFERSRQEERIIRVYRQVLAGKELAWEPRS